MELTDLQKNIFDKIVNFLNSDDKVFLLKGYAGSGKTFVVSKIVNYLQNNKQEFVLIAPTGKAASVISNKTKIDANTIHKTIYNFTGWEHING